MGLDSILRNAIATANSVTSSLQSTILHEAWIGQDGYGKPTYATGVQRQAIVEMRQRRRPLPDGRELIQEAHITFVQPIAANGASERREPIDPRDRITLPSGLTGPIHDVRGVVDPGTNQPYLLEVVLGELRT